MERTFTLAEARALLPGILARADQLIPLRAELAQRAHAMEDGGEAAIPEVKALEARLSELLDWFRGHGIQVKGFAPLLLDLPVKHGHDTLLVCWLEGERQLGWYHDPALGFMGRRPLSELEAG